MISIVETKDGSHTLYNSIYDAHYHSIHGAIQESEHVFIKEGLVPLSLKLPGINVIEFGFGSGLNVYLSFLFAQKNSIQINYLAIDNTPIPPELYKALNYPQILEEGDTRLFNKIHEQEWNSTLEYSNKFRFTKVLEDFRLWDTELHFDLVFFDAFSPAQQSELWDIEMINKIYRILGPNGLMTTYCAKGSLKRTLRAAGFVVEKRPGPPGKREMICAHKK